jgi:carbon monoxide dehydrogenase subunit G
MTKIESKVTSVDSGAEKIFSFLTDMNNIEKLLPEGKYSDWKSDVGACSFKVQNAYHIGLALKSSEPNHLVSYSSTPGSPFPFELNVKLIEKDGKTQGQLLCDAQINPFLEMLVKGPLKNLFDYMADKLPQAISEV